MNAAFLGRADRALSLTLPALFFLFCLFPYLAILPLPTDTQPNALILAALLVAIAGAGTPLPLPVWALAGLFLLSLGLLAGEAGQFAAWRSALGYGSLFFVAAAACCLARREIRLPARAIAFAVYAWFAAGAIQALLDPRLLVGIVSSVRTTADRGVTALAPEPSHYATVAAFLLILLFLRGRERSLAGLLCIVQIIALAQSAQVALVLLLALAAYAVLLIRAAALLLLMVVVVWLAVVALPLVAFDVEGSRILRLAGLLIEDPTLLVLADASGSQRFASIFFSAKGALDAAFLPRGLATFPDYMAAELPEWRQVFWFAPPVDRISSGYGAALYELGLFGLAVPAVLAAGLARFFAGDRRRLAVASLAVHPLMITAVPLALPLVGLLIGELYSGRSPVSRRVSAPG